MKTAYIKFKNNNVLYAFKTDLDLVFGQVVVCDTVNGYIVGTVSDISDDVDKKAKKWIVDVVDVRKHERRLKLEKKKDQIKKKLEDRRKQLQDISVYKILAEKDIEMSKLLKEYEEIMS